MILKKATRQQVKLRMGLSAVAGGGKTMSALLLAYGMTGDWGKIGLIDTENRSASLYSHLGEFLTLELEAPYSPERYIEAIDACEKGGVEVIIIDSITHEWDGKGGCLAIWDSLGGKFQNWAKVSPRHQAFIDKILSSKCHVITTVRRKQEYEMTKDNQGKVVVEKVGLKEVTREGFEYELTVNFNIEANHQANASKDRTGLFADKPSFIISEETGKKILNWCNEGTVREPSEQELLHKEYVGIIYGALHVFNEADCEKYTAGSKDWTAKSLKIALEQIKELKTKREAALQSEAHSKLVAAQQ